MKIVDVHTHVLLDPGFDQSATSSAQDTVIVEIVTDEGLTGIGETDLNGWVVRALIEAPGTHTMARGLKEMLIGRDPLNPEEIWHDLYVGSAMTGRRGAGVNAIGAIDMALWDLCGKARGVPCWQLWGEGVRAELTPYASLQPESSTYGEYLESMVAWAKRAQAIGFRACKLETTFSGPYVHRGLDGPDERMTEIVAAVRQAVGTEMTIMVDVQYAFDSVDRALRVIGEWAQLDVFFVETPLWVDDIAGYAELAARSPVRIAAGEWLSTRYEFESLITEGKVSVAQPDIGRVGGFSEARRVCASAAQHDCLIVPHAWKTGLSTAAAAHLAMVTPHMPYFEYLVPDLCESRLRKELVIDEEIVFQDGVLRHPSRPGLGVEIDREAVSEFAAAARRKYL